MSWPTSSPGWRTRSPSIPTAVQPRSRWCHRRKDGGSYELNDVRSPYPDAATIDELVRRVASEMPDAVAVDDGTESVSYAELVDRAEAVAVTLRDAGARAGEAVAVMFPRGADCVAAMLGVLF